MTRAHAATLAHAGIARGRQSRLSRPGLAALIFALVAVGFFNPIFRSNATFETVAGHQSIQFPWAATPAGLPDAVQSDQANYVYPITVDVHRSPIRGLLPEWSRSSFGGLPTAGSVYSAMAYPGHLVLLALFSPSWAHDLFLLLHVWLAGLAMYLLLRVLRLSWLASVIGGISWMLCPAWFGLIMLEGNAALAALLPLALAAGLVAVQRRSLAALVGCGVAQALLIIGASVQNGVFAMLIVGAAMAFDRTHAGEAASWLRGVWRNLWFAVPANVLGIMLAGFVLLPSQGAIAGSRRSVIPYSELVGSLGMSLHRLGDAISPDVPRPVTGNTVWTLLFIGSAGAVLALIGLVSRRQGAWLGRSITIVFLALLTGSPLAWIAYHTVPGFGYLSPLGRLTPYLAFGAVILIATGADTALAAIRRISGRQGGAIAVSLAVIVGLLQIWQLATFDRAVNPPFQPRTTADLFPETPLLRSLMSAHRDAVASGRAQRILLIRKGSATDPFFPPPLYGDIAQIFGLESIGGYFNVIPPRSVAIARVLGGTPDDQAAEPIVGALATSFFAAQSRLDLVERLGITQIVGAPRAFPDPALAKGLRPLAAKVTYSGIDGTVYTLPHAQPRAFFVSGSETVSSELAALDRFTAKGFPYRSTVLLDGKAGTPRVPAAGPEVRATIVHAGDDSLKLRVRAPRAGWVVVLDSYASGWSASVNGHSTSIRRGDYAYRAVAVGPGTSTIDMRYSPPGLVSGIALSALGVLVAIGLPLVPRWRRRRAARRTPQGPADTA